MRDSIALCWWQSLAPPRTPRPGRYNRHACHTETCASKFQEGVGSHPRDTALPSCWALFCCFSGVVGVTIFKKRLQQRVNVPGTRAMERLSLLLALLTLAPACAAPSRRKHMRNRVSMHDALDKPEKLSAGSARLPGYHRIYRPTPVWAAPEPGSGAQWILRSPPGEVWKLSV